MKLKTLKDLDEEWIKNFETNSIHQPGGGLSDRTQRVWFRDGHKVAHEYTVKEIKAEAVKWIQFYEKEIKEMIYQNAEFSWLSNREAKIQFIMEFFNITEEDLK